MPPAFQRCGDIVWQCKKHARSYAFRCLFCEHISAAFRDFKLHLEAEHGQQLDEIKVEEEPPPLQPKMEPPEEEEEEEMELELDPLDELQEQSSSDENVDLEEDDSLFELSQDSESEGNDELEEEEERQPLADTKQFWLQEHPIMFALIDQIEQRRVVWDINMGCRRNNKPLELACEQIAQQLNAEFQLKLSGQDIAVYNRKLRTIYSYEQNKQALGKRGEHYKPKWYHQRLSFLKDYISFRPRGRRVTKNRESADLALPVPQLSHEQNLRLIEIYRRCQGAWDMQDMSCRLPRKRQLAHEELLRLCRQELALEADLQQEQLHRFVDRIRFAFTQQRTRRFECERQGGKFAPSCRYYEQLQFLEQHVSPFQCEICEQVFTACNAFMLHRAKHDGSMPFVCPICGKGFLNISNCKVHMARHSQDDRVPCEDCGLRFACNREKEMHRRKHTGEKPYCCDVCGKSFRLRSFFLRHKRRHDAVPQFKCHICGKSFYEKFVLQNHIKAHLNVRDTVCDICQKTFTCKKYLRQHKHIHELEKRFSCRLCGRKFAQSAGLCTHMKSHGTPASSVLLEAPLEDASSPDDDEEEEEEASLEPAPKRQRPM